MFSQYELLAALFMSCPLTHYGPVTPVTIVIVLNFGSGNGLLPDGTKPLPEPMLIYHTWDPVILNEEQFHRKCSGYVSHKMCLKIPH